MRNALLALVATASFFCGPSEDHSSPSATGIQDRILVRRLTYPWEILWGPDNHIWMTERDGRISRVNPTSGAVTPIYTLPDIRSNGEGGLLGMALHPQFATAPYVYVSYNYHHNSYKEKVVRFTYKDNTLTSPKILVEDIEAGGIHNGSRLLIVKDKLYITTGETGNPSLAQNTASLNGKILRINLDGSIPADNPIANSPVWSWGHRNPQGLVLVYGTLFSSEHGPSTDDEINIIEKGRNYGWPDVQGFCNEPDEKLFCQTHAIKEPLKTWTPTAAVSGMDYYDSDLIPAWKNSLLVTALKNSRLYQLKLNDSHTAITETNEFFNNKYGRLRDVCISPDGKVYICTSNGEDDKIIEVTSP